MSHYVIKFIIIVVTMVGIFGNSTLAFKNHAPTMPLPSNHESNAHWLRSIALSHDNKLLYALNSINDHNDAVYVYDLILNKIDRIINLNSYGRELILSHNSERLYLPGYVDVLVIDLKNNDKIEKIHIADKMWICDLALNSDDKKLYASACGSSTGIETPAIYEIDVAQKIINKKILSKYCDLYTDGYTQIFTLPHSEKLYLFSPHRGIDCRRSMVAQLDLINYKLDEQIERKIGILEPDAFSYDETRHLLYIFDNDKNLILAVDPVSYKIINSLQPPFGISIFGDMIISKDGKKMYIASDSDKYQTNVVTAIDLVNFKILSNIVISEYNKEVQNKTANLRLSADGKFVYAGNTRDFTVAVIDTTTDTIVKTIDIAGFVA